MKTLRAPENVLSASVGGRTVNLVDGICEVADHEASELISHGFTLVTPATDPRPPKDGEEMSQLDVTIAMLNRAERPELFAIAKQNGIALPANMKTEKMREVLVEHTRTLYKATEPAKQDPAKTVATGEPKTEQPSEGA